MTFFHRAHASELPTSPIRRTLILGAAATLVILAVSQLFSFEKFPALITVLVAPHTAASGLIDAALITLLEVAAIPALLGMALSPAMRATSTLAGYLVWGFWLTSCTATMVLGQSATNSGLLGASIYLPATWLTVVLVVLLAGLFIAAQRTRYRVAQSAA